MALPKIGQAYPYSGCSDRGWRTLPCLFASPCSVLLLKPPHRPKEPRTQGRKSLPQEKPEGLDRAPNSSWSPETHLGWAKPVSQHWVMLKSLQAGSGSPMDKGKRVCPVVKAWLVNQEAAQAKAAQPDISIITEQEVRK